MRVVQNFSIQLPAAVTNLLATSQKPAAGGAQALTLTATTTLTPPRRITVSSDGNDTSRVFTVVGTDWYNNSITENITGISSSTATSTLSYATVVSITVDANTAGNITAGSATQAETPAFMFNPYGLEGASLHVKLASGAVTYTVQQTVENLYKFRPDQVEWLNSGDNNVVSATASQQSNYAYIPAACRVTLTGTGKLVININQAGGGWS